MDQRERPAPFQELFNVLDDNIINQDIASTRGRLNTVHTQIPHDHTQLKEEISRLESYDTVERMTRCVSATQLCK